jgi:hypothetical protein
MVGPLVVIVTLAFIFVVVVMIFRGVFTSPKIDDFANDFCDFKPKDAKTLCKEGEKVFDALEDRVEENEIAQTKLKEKNDEIKSFSRKLSERAKCDEDSTDEKSEPLPETTEV